MSSTSRFFPYSLVLPNMPGVAAKLMNSLSDDSLTLNSLADLVGKDPALAAKVLRLANSARYSPLRSVSSLREATASLGMVMLRNLAMASCMSGAFPTIAGLDRKQFWRHGIATAHYAVLIARASFIDADTAYLGGLMVRTGQLLMLQVDKPGVAEVEKQIQRPGGRFALEQARWGCTHSDVTAELARRWQFPAPLVAAFAAAAQPLKAQPYVALGGVLHLAEALADAIDQEVDAVAALQEHLPDLVARLRLNTVWLQDKLLNAADLQQEVELMTAG